MLQDTAVASVAVYLIILRGVLRLHSHTLHIPAASCRVPSHLCQSVPTKYLTFGRSFVGVVVHTFYPCCYIFRCRRRLV